MIDAVLLARFGSCVLVETVTVFVIEPFFAITVTTIWVALVAPVAMEPMLQLTVPDDPGAGVTHVPRLGMARPTGVERADAINVRIPIEGADIGLAAAGA